MLAFDVVASSQLLGNAEYLNAVAKVQMCESLADTCEILLFFQGLIQTSMLEVITVRKFIASTQNAP